MATATLQQTPEQVKLYHSRIDLPEDVRRQIIPALQTTLFATIDLKWQIKQAHWNVKGPDFIALHKLFDELSVEIDEYADETAERITALAGHAIGNIRRGAQGSPLGELRDDVNQAMELLGQVSDRYSEYAKLLRENINLAEDLEDKGSADLFTGISRQVDQRLWFLEAHLN